MSDSQPKFVHRVTAAFTYDSLCLRCFRTVGTRRRESELRFDEAEHLCKGLPLHPKETPVATK